MAYRVLLVDDDPVVLNAIALSLASDFGIDTASSGSEAIERLLHTKYDAIVSDMNMPAMNGVALLGHVFENYPATARLLLTGGGSLEEDFETLNEGRIFLLLRKPCSPSMLRMSIHAAIQARLTT